MRLQLILNRLLFRKKKYVSKAGTGFFAGTFAFLLRILTTGRAFSPDMSDAELVHLCQTRGMKDERPFQELFHRYQDYVWRTCYHIARNPQDAEDLTQEVFFKVYRSLSQFEGRSSFKTWVYRIAVNTCQNEIRRRSRRPPVSESDIDTMAEVLPSDVSVEAVLKEKSEWELLAQAMAHLRPEECEVIQLKDLEQHPYTEIARMLDISLSATKMRVQRARLALQASYRRLESDTSVIGKR